MAERLRVGELDARGGEILRLIVGEYIRSGEPVGSRTISKAMNRRLSPATIRNIMADLEEAGYLSQPHTSAGRIPSEKAYRYYVDCLGSSRRPAPSAEKYIRTRLAAAHTPEEVMSTASCLLSDISNNVGVVVSAPIDVSVLQHIEFIRLDEGKLLVILVSQTGSVEQKVIHVDEAYSQDELVRAGNYLVERFSGCTLPEIRRELVLLMRQERMQYDTMLRRLLATWSHALDEADPSAGSVYLHGTGNILPNLDLSDVARMQELFRMFEEKGRLVKILNGCLGPDSADGVQITIGSELGDPCMRGFTVIGALCPGGGATAGFMGIIGPTRMEYRKGISVVSYLANLCGRMIHA